MSPNPTPFHQLLERERQKRGVSIRHLATCARVSEAQFKLWASGAELPTKNQIFAMFGQGTSLVNYLPHESVPPLPRAEPGSLGSMAYALVKANVSPVIAARAVSAAPPVSVQVAPVAEVPAPALPWNEILRDWRKKEGLTIDELGVLLDVAGSTISNWELAKFPPIASHLDKLRGLVPALAEVVIPGSRDITKPGKGTGSPATAATLPPVLVATVDPLAAIDRILMSFDSLGQSVNLAAPERTDEGTWIFKLVDRGAAADVAPLAIGAGPSMPAAALDMLGSLRASFASRQEQTADIVRKATVRLEAQTKALGAIDGALGIGGIS